MGENGDSGRRNLKPLYLKRYYFARDIEKKLNPNQSFFLFF